MGARVNADDLANEVSRAQLCGLAGSIPTPRVPAELVSIGPRQSRFDRRPKGQRQFAVILATKVSGSQVTADADDALPPE